MSGAYQQRLRIHWNLGKQPSQQLNSE